MPQRKLVSIEDKVNSKTKTGKAMDSDVLNQLNAFLVYFIPLYPESGLYNITQ